MSDPILPELPDLPAVSAPVTYPKDADVWKGIKFEVVTECHPDGGTYLVGETYVVDDLEWVRNADISMGSWAHTTCNSENQDEASPAFLRAFTLGDLKILNPGIHPAFAFLLPKPEEPSASQESSPFRDATTAAPKKDPYAERRWFIANLISAQHPVIGKAATLGLLLMEPELFQDKVVRVTGRLAALTVNPSELRIAKETDWFASDDTKPNHELSNKMLRTIL